MTWPSPQSSKSGLPFVLSINDVPEAWELYSRAGSILLPVAQQALLDEGLVVVEVLAGGPQAQVGVVVLARTGQLPVRAREQRVGPRAAPQVQHDGTNLHSFFTGPVFFARPRILPDHACPYGWGAF